MKTSHLWRSAPKRLLAAPFLGIVLVIFTLTTLLSQGSTPSVQKPKFKIASLTELSPNTTSNIINFDLSSASTSEANEVSSGGGRTQWWKYTPTSSYSVTLGIGAAAGAVSMCVTTVTTACNVGTTASGATYALTAGTTYYFRASPNGGSIGSFMLTRGTYSSSFKPNNDNFANAQVIPELSAGVSSGPINIDFNNLTVEGGEAATIGTAKTAWFKYTPTSSYTVNFIQAGISGNIALCVATAIGSCSVGTAIYSGTTAYALTSGTTYYFRVNPNTVTFGTIYMQRVGTDNDAFANATVISEQAAGATTSPIAVDLTNATFEVSETGNTRGRWWSYTPTANQTIDISTTSFFDSGGLTPCVSTTNAASCANMNDNANNTFSYALTAGTNYRIRLGVRYAGEIGSFILSRAGSDNDNFANATAVTELSAGASSTPAAFDMSHSTVEPNEINNLGSGYSRWWKYTPTANYSLNISSSTANLGSTVQCITTVISSCSVGGNNAGGAAYYAYALTSGTTYYIRISTAYATTKGYLTFTRPAADNDSFANANSISELSPGASTGPIAVDLANATVEGGEYATGQRSRWWTYTPTSSYIVNVSMSTADVGTLIQCVTTVIGSCTVGANTTSNGTFAYSLTANTTYYIRMASTFGTTRALMTVVRSGADNDLFANATVIPEVAASASSSTMPFNLTGATIEPGEVSYGNPSRWWQYTPTSSYVVNIAEATPDNGNVAECVTIAIGSCSVGSNSNNGSFAYSLTANTTYYIRIGRVGAAVQGTLVLTRAGTDNDLFANATTIPEVALNAAGSVIPFDLSNATVEPSENNTYVRSRWWKYTPTATYSLNISTGMAGAGSVQACVTTTFGSCSVGSNASSGSATSAYALTSGTTYYIRIGQNNAAYQGTLLLSRGTVADSFTPPNDAFASATTISELSAGTNTGPVAVDTYNATVEGGEVAYGSGGSQWWKYTPTSSYIVNIANNGAAGTLATCLTTAIGSCSVGSNNTTSTTAYALTSGTTYYIRVAGQSTKLGAFILYREAGGNDDFVGATTIAEPAVGANSGMVTYDASNATIEPGESSSSSYRTLWFKYTPSSSYNVNVSGFSSTGTGGVCITTALASCSVASFTSAYTGGYSFTSGTTYYIRVFTFGSATGALMVARSAGGNDSFSGATSISELALGANTGVINYDVSNATVEPGEMSNYEQRSLWWKYTPTSTYTVNISAKASSDYAGFCLTTVMSSCNIGFIDGAYTASLTSGTTYYFRAAANGPNTGGFAIYRSQGGNDDFSGATAIPEMSAGGTSAPIFFNTVAATSEVGEVGNANQRSLWWKYTPTSTYAINLSASGNIATTTYCLTTSISTCSFALTNSPSVTAYTLSSGTTYYIRMMSNGSDTGALSLSRTNAVANDDFANATTVPEVSSGGSSGIFNVDTSNATIESSEVSLNDQRSLWWKYTPTSSYIMNVNEYGYGNNMTLCMTTVISSCSLQSFSYGGNFAYMVTSGTTYYLRLTSTGTTNGSFQINRDNASNNDDFANAANITQWDTTSPTAGSVFDGTNAGIETSSSNGSLTALSANVTGFSDAGTGINTYDYSIGTSAGDVSTRGWTSGGAGPTINATGLSLTAGRTYFFNVRANDYAGNMSTVVSSPGQQVTPLFTFTVAGVAASTACGDVTTTVASTSSSAAFGSIGSGATPVLGTTLSVSTNAANGYAVTVRGSAPASASGRTIAGVSGTNTSPAAWPAAGTEAFGYATSSSTLSGTAARFRTGLWAAISNTPGEVMRNASTPAGTDNACVAFGQSKSAITAAGTYSTIITYTAVPSF